jgi:hypothetical protein
MCHSAKRKQNAVRKTAPSNSQLHRRIDLAFENQPHNVSQTNSKKY